MEDDIIGLLNIKNYVESVRVKAEDARPLTLELVNAAAALALDQAEQKALERTVRCADAVEAVLNDREQVAEEMLSDLRASVITNVGGLEAILSGLAKIERCERAATARALHRVLFLDGLGFLKSVSMTMWAVADRRMRLLDARGKKALLEEIVGRDVLSAVESSVAALGEALGVGSTAREIPDSTALSKKTTQYRRALGAYGRLLAAKLDEEDPGSIERFRKAIGPIDLYRVRRIEVEAPAEPEAPADPTTEPLPVEG